MPEAAWCAMRVPPDVAALPEVAAKLAVLGAANRVPEDVLQQLDIAVDELLANVIEHGRPGVDIELQIWIDGEAVTIEIVDAGPSFNPFSRPPPDTGASLDDRVPGGLGVHFVRSLMDQYEWHRRDNRNVTRIRKKRSATNT